MKRLNKMNEKIIDLKASFQDFWKAAKIYYDHPNSINKQIIISQHLFCGELPQLLQDNNEVSRLFEHFSNYIACDIETYKGVLNSKYTIFNNENINMVWESSKGVYFLLRKLIPKRNIEDMEFFEFLFLDKGEDKGETQLFIYTYHKYLVNENYKSQYLKTRNPFSILKFKFITLKFALKTLRLIFPIDLEEKGITWLNAIFLPKFKNLIMNKSGSSASIKENFKKFNKIHFSNMVNIVEYYKLYEKMKSKYADFLIKNWTENTDPQKFVYEDIGIATYLLLLWNDGKIPDDSFKKQRFIDMGCGNGLLVYILNSEGHLGIGLDMRKRKIWDLYDEKTILKVETIMPTKNTKYPEVDWLIGNHSDELTPWLPIMARSNGKSCQYFVIPCCPYQLNGQKFQRQNSCLSSYQDFLHYVKDISQLCNFETYIDRLRIPSTKRICLIGLRKPDLSINSTEVINNKISDFIQLNCSSETNKLSTAIIKIRDSVERVRNCTKLQKDVIDNILLNIMITLLGCQNYIKLENNQMWNKGGKVAIQDLAKSLDSDLLKELKNECKGLQTLLKNHHYIFEVANGMVEFHSPDKLKKISEIYFKNKNKMKWKNKNCWFHNYHPDGCPLDNDKCSYQHA